MKSAIWMISLGSGTSGGVLAPLLMMGAALGGLEGMFLPHFGAGFWALVGMGAILGGAMRAPFAARRSSATSPIPDVAPVMTTVLPCMEFPPKDRTAGYELTPRFQAR